MDTVTVCIVIITVCNVAWFALAAWAGYQKAKAEVITPEQRGEYDQLKKAHEDFRKWAENAARGN